MHESNFTKQIVHVILQELTKNSDARPQTVKVRVGEMLHLVPESVEMHYELLTKGTPLAGVKLELEEIPVRVRCRPCGHEGSVADHHLLVCGECGSFDVELLNGNEIRIDSIEIYDE